VYGFTAIDTLAGIWQSKDRVTVIKRESSKIYDITASLWQQVPYQAALRVYSYERKGKELILLGEYGETKKYVIKEIKQDEIKFEDGSTWLRVR